MGTNVDGSPLFQLHHKLRMVMEATRAWSAERGLAESSIHVAKEKLHLLVVTGQSQLNDVQVQDQIHGARNELQELQECEAPYLQQQAHINWLTNGVQLSSFFAKAITMRRTKNSLMHTMDVHDNKTNSLTTMKVRAVAYFHDLYSCLVRQ